MSITVTANGNGTLTIQCGGESIIVGAPLPKKPDEPDIPVLWPSGGATANIIATGKAKTVTVEVASARLLREAIEEQYKKRGVTSDSTVFDFNVGGTDPLDIDNVNQVLKDLGHPEWMGTQIRLTGGHE